MSTYDECVTIEASVAREKPFGTLNPRVNNTIGIMVIKTNEPINPRSRLILLLLYPGAPSSFFAFNGWYEH